MKATTKQLIGYHIFVAVLAVLSSVLAGLMLLHIPIAHIWHLIFYYLWAYFVADYLVRFLTTKDRKRFLIENAFDLLGIVPMHPAFALFRLTRLVSMVRAHHLFWRLGISGEWTRSFHRFTYDTGFIYLFSISVVIICISALLFSAVEKQSLGESLWWAVTTATTVGYGDDSPRTVWGKMIATVLMLGGVGFIGLLTSTITGFFTSQADDQVASHSENDQLEKQVAALTQEVAKLSDKIDRLNK